MASYLADAHFALVVTAQATSLYIPGFDPQPVTILSELGVGADGATTWLVAPGTPSGDFQDSGFFGPGMHLYLPPPEPNVQLKPALLQLP